MPRLIPVVLLLAAGLSCRFDTTLSMGLVITCVDHPDCPVELRCQKPRGFCVSPESLDVDPPVITKVVTKIVPGAGNPLANPTKVTLGSILELGFSVNEKLGKPPEVTSAPLACAPLRNTDFDWSFLCVVVPMPPQGQAEIRAKVEDVVGLTFEGPLALDPVVVIDTVPPPDPATGTPGLIIYERAPLGTDSSMGLPRFTLIGGASAAPEAIQVRARSSVFPRGTSDVDAQGAFGPTALVPLDAEQLEISSVDEAGNTSAWVKVRDGRWIATMTGKVAGNTRRNPHRFDTVGAHGSGVARADVLEHDDSEGLGAKGGPLVTVAGRGSWARHGSAASAAVTPPIAAVWDAQRAKAVVIFEDSSTVEMTGNGWMLTRLGDPENDGQPPFRSGAMGVYDERAGRTLLFGGFGGNEVRADVWSYDGQSWRRLGDAPAIYSGAAVYDPVSGRTIVAGVVLESGSDAGESASTFIFKDGQWSELPGSLPARRALWSMATDRRGQVLGYGGIVNGTTSSQVLSFDGERWQPSPSAGLPPRRDALMVFDEERSRWLISGGRQSDGGAPLDGFQRADDAGSWTPLSPSFVNARSFGIYDPVHSQVISPINQVASEAFNGTSWFVHGYGSSPKEGNTITCALDGGCLLVRGVRVQTLEPTIWSAAATVTATFDGGLTVAAWDDARSELVISTAWRTWRWNGTQPATEVGGGPGLWLYADLAQQGNELLFINSLGGTRRWDGALWVDGGTWAYQSDYVAIDDIQPGAALAHSVKLGTSGCSGATPTTIQTLSRDAGQWADVSDLLPRKVSMVAYDPVRGRPYAFGGVLPGMALEATDDLFERADDGGWQRMLLSDPEGDLGPVARTFGQFGFDAQKRVGVLLGGATSVSELDLDDTWLLSIANQRPAAYFTVEIGEANLPPGWVPIGVHVTAEAGGSSQAADGSPITGARSLVFTGRRWVDITTTPGGSAAAPATVLGAMGDVTEVPWRENLTFGLVPRGTNGTGTAELSVDYVEVQLDYRLPP